MGYVFKSIGHIKTPYKFIEDCPRNIEANGPMCSLVVNSKFSDGLLGLYAGQEILILYWLDRGDRERLQQPCRVSGKNYGVFALRTPNRPNPIGAAVVRIERVEGGVVDVRGLDCLSGTHLLDIKPVKLRNVDATKVS
jgi:tRNA-Thr(GGU) m(6)t(6)A37 methyltransferase TsaA